MQIDPGVRYHYLPMVIGWPSVRISPTALATYVSTNGQAKLGCNLVLISTGMRLTIILVTVCHCPRMGISWPLRLLQAFGPAVPAM